MLAETASDMEKAQGLVSLRDEVRIFFRSQRFAMRHGQSGKTNERLVGAQVPLRRRGLAGGFQVELFGVRPLLTVFANRNWRHGRHPSGVERF